MILLYSVSWDDPAIQNIIELFPYTPQRFEMDAHRLDIKEGEGDGMS